MGTPMRVAKERTFALPTMAFAMPPPVSPVGLGSFVKKFQFK